MLIYRGNRPAQVVKAAKYSVVHGTAGKFEVRLIYVLDKREKMLLTSSDHPDLVAMVNKVKEEVNGAPCGAFYINEHRQVLVPAGPEYYLAGDYERLLEFRDGSNTIGPKPPVGTQPGQPWRGPRPGIPYTLAAGGDDVYYEEETERRTVRRVMLSDFVGAAGARRLAKRLAQHKGSGGGRIYINEAKEFFAPVANGEGSYDFVYLGWISDDGWFGAGRGEQH